MITLALVTLAVVSSVSFVNGAAPVPQDPCVKLAGQKWAAPGDVRACYSSFKVDPAIKSNIIDVIGKTMAFHTSTNYQIQAPPPFQRDVHEDVLADLKRIGSSNYRNDYDLHIDLSRTLKRLNDGHCVWINNCYDSAFTNYIPTPLVLLTDRDGRQNVHIAPRAFEVASTEFPDQIETWQNALPRHLKGGLASLSGAKVLLINGRSPWDAVDANAAITGSYQAVGTRQNSFFSSYQLTASGWTYVLGNFAQQSLPLHDSVTLTLQLANDTKIETITLPYRSRIGNIKQFTDGVSYYELNCRAKEGTNGKNLYEETVDISSTPFAKAQAQPKLSPADAKKHKVNVVLDATPAQDAVLPPALTPADPLPGGYSVAQFYMLEDGKTGVMALGSFSAASYDGLMQALLDGLLALKSKGATQLLIDVTNNGGGYICAAHFLHRIIAGPKKTTVPQAGLDGAARAGPLAQQIVKNIIKTNADPDLQLLYNPMNWRDAQTNEFITKDWLDPPVRKIINSREDAFSIRVGNECQPEGFPVAPPDEALFDPQKVVIIGNGRCASSCSLFSITMSKLEGTKTVVVGGKKNVPQNYCGIVGGQSTGFSTMDSEIKTTGLKNSTLAPPDLLVNGVQGITWRLGYGIDNPNEPEEWQNHPATYNWGLNAETANNPAALWKDIAGKVLH